MPDEPPVNMPSPPKIHSLGTTSDLALKLKKGNEERRCKLVSESIKERDEREKKGLGDCWAEQQDTKHPNIDSTFVGYKLEMLFEYPNTLEGGTYLDWAHGIVENIVNTKTGRVRVRWHKDCVGIYDKAVTVEKLFPKKYNPAVAVKGAWREYIRDDT